MINLTTVRRVVSSVCAALALTAVAGSFAAPAAHASSKYYVPNPPSGYPSKIKGDNRPSECFWFFDCRDFDWNWSFCDYNWWGSHLYKVEINYCVSDPYSCEELVQVKFFGYDLYHCGFYPVACGSGAIKTIHTDFDCYRDLCFALNLPNDHLDTLFFEIELTDCGTWGWYHEISNWNCYYPFGLTPFWTPF
jgi:hypothetical protein